MARLLLGAGWGFVEGLAFGGGFHPAAVPVLPTRTLNTPPPGFVGLDDRRYQAVHHCLIQCHRDSSCILRRLARMA